MDGKVQEIDTDKLRELLKERDELHPLDDFGLQKVWDKMLYYCGNDEEKIVSFLSKLNLNDLGTMSEIFEELSEKLNKSKTFKKSLEEITSKYPDADFCLQYV